MLPKGVEPVLPESVRLARLARLGDSTSPTIGDTRRRRFELVALLAVLVVAVPSALGLSFTGEGWLGSLGGALVVARVILVLLSVTFVAYVLEKERALRKLARALSNERALRGAFETHLAEVGILAEARTAIGADPMRVYDLVAAEAVRLLEADESTLMVLRDTELVVLGEGGRRRALHGNHQPIDSGVAGYVARTGTPLLLQGELDQMEVANYLGEWTPRRGRAPASSIVVPIPTSDGIIGVVSVNLTDGPRLFDARDLRLLSLFAEESATVLRIASGADVRSVPTRERAPVGTDEPQAPSPDRLTILIAGADPATLATLETAFGARGHDAVLASNRRETLRLSMSERPAVMVYDASAPVADGPAALQDLLTRSNPPRILCLTGRGSQLEQMRDWMLGTDDCVDWPAPPGAVVEAAEALAARSEAEREERRHLALRGLLRAGTGGRS